MIGQEMAKVFEWFRHELSIRGVRTLEVFLEVQMSDGVHKVASAKVRNRGLLFWHELSVEELKELICKEEE